MVGAPDLDGRLALDANGLGRLRMAARQNSPEAVREVAQQFEAMLLNMMLKSMRDATPSDGPFDNEQTRSFTAMLDQQLSQSLAGRGTGLADVLVRQLTQSAGVRPLEAPSAPIAVPSAAAGTLPPHAAAFRQGMLPHAVQASRDSGIPAHFMVGQAALESGWGQHEIRHADGRPSHNLFGIKATGNWHGKVAETMTTEYVNGEKLQRVEKFRAYDSYADAFKDFAGLISKNPRYRAAMNNLQQPDGYARALQQAGYATDPDYADKLIRVIQHTSSA